MSSFTISAERAADLYFNVPFTCPCNGVPFASPTTNGEVTVTLTQKVNEAYAAELARHGSYDAARQAVMARYKLSAGRVEALVAAGRKGES